jgi:hypothetical protein
LKTLELVQVYFTLDLEGMRDQKKLDEKSTWQQMDNVSWFISYYVRSINKRWVLCTLGVMTINFIVIGFLNYYIVIVDPNPNIWYGPSTWSSLTLH